MIDKRKTIAQTIKNARNVIRESGISQGVYCRAESSPINATMVHCSYRLRNMIARERASHCLARAGIKYPEV